MGAYEDLKSELLQREKALSDERVASYKERTTRLVKDKQTGKHFDVPNLEAEQGFAAGKYDLIGGAHIVTPDGKVEFYGEKTLSEFGLPEGSRFATPLEENQRKAEDYRDENEDRLIFFNSVSGYIHVPIGDC